MTFLKPTILFFLFILKLVFTYGQTSSEWEKAKNFLELNNIKLNKVNPPKGFKVYYNCDSMLFLRGNFKDTIKIWTPSVGQPQELKIFKETLKDKDYGITVFAEQIFDDGRIMVEYYHQTEFIFRKDSLYQIENTVKYPQEIIIKNIKLLMDSTITQKEFDSIQDSVLKEFKKISIYKPKLIFTKNMFKGKIKKVRLSKKFNFKEDTIILENKFIKNGLNCHTVRIDNDKYDTNYAYIINEKMEFIQWQGCVLKN